MVQKFCRNHPQKITAYRCYYCKDSICKECRIKLDHHFFCGYKCFVKYKFSEILRFFKKQKFASLVTTQFLLLLIIFLQFLYLSHRFNQFQKEKTTKVPTEKLLLSDIKQYITHYQPMMQDTQHITLNQGYYSFKFDVKKNWIMNIWRNKQPISANLVKHNNDNSFRIPLKYGNNDIQIMVFNETQELEYRDRLNIQYLNEQVETLRHSIEHGYKDQKKIALTFDAGSDDAHTIEILDILRDNDLKCTLFLTGTFMQTHPDLLRQMVEDGHEIGNHTYTHPHFTSFAKDFTQQTLESVDRSFVQKQLLKTDSLFFSLTGQHLKPYWRAPFGEYNSEILTWAAEVGYLHIRWTNQFDTYDWVTDESSKLFRTPDQIYEHFMAFDKENPDGLNGIIVLMHLGSHRNGNHIYQTLPKLIHSIRQKGYKIGSVTNLLS